MLAVWVLLGFAMAALAPALVGWRRDRAGRLLALYPVTTMLWAATYRAGETQEEVWFAWLPSFGLTWGVYVDGLSLLFTWLIAGIGLLIVLYSAEYLSGHRHLGRFASYLLGFMASMLGLVLADNLLLLFVCWELTSLFSYLLIGFKAEDEKSRKAALKALLTTSVGGVALLVGFLLLHEATGTWRVSVLLAGPPLPASHPWAVPIVVLVLLGALTKSAQFPFHFWLPAAMAAPTPVSAYLHSATMVKAGVFLIARLGPVLGAAPLWRETLVVVGTLTMVAGALLALPQRDGKLLLAYSTVSALGTLVLLLGLGTPAAIGAAMLFLFAHALYKGGLFLSVGIVDWATGSRDVDALGALRHALPWTAIATLVLALSLAGIPPALGFIAKEQLLEAALHSSVGEPLWWIAAIVVAAACQVAIAVAVLRPFFGRPAMPAPREPRQPPPAMTHAPIVLALVSLAAALPAPHAIVELLSAAARASGGSGNVHIALWHGLTPALGASAVAVLFGAALACGRRRVQSLAQQHQWVVGFGPTAAYEFCLRALNGVARWQTRVLQSGVLRQYQVLLLGAALVATLALVVSHWPSATPEWSVGVTHAFEFVVALSTLAGAAVAVWARSRLTAVVGLGVTGYGVALLFLLFGAPDLAMTQFAIETLTVVLFVLVLYRLPPFLSRSSLRTRIRDACLAIALGATLSLALLVTLTQSAGSQLAPYFMEHSLPEGKGRNVVNVILVDFRSLDTLGEITVLGTAAIGVAALLAAARRMP